MAPAAYAIDKRHISASSSIFKGSEWMSYRLHKADAAAKHKLAANYSLIVMEINLIERPEQLQNGETFGGLML